MEKLIELIVNFTKEIGNTTYEISKYHYDDELKLIVVLQNNTTFIDSIDIYRLFFGSDFIKWLVENDKIDYMKIHKGFCIEKVFYFEGEVDHTEELDYKDELLMLLAISEKPIEDLISYLK